MYTLTKAFRFESAHRLAKGYEGKCANIHGHSWNGELTVEIDTACALVSHADKMAAAEAMAVIGTQSRILMSVLLGRA